MIINMYIIQKKNLRLPIISLHRFYSIRGSGMVVGGRDRVGGRMVCEN